MTRHQLSRRIAVMERQVKQKKPQTSLLDTVLRSLSDDEFALFLELSESEEYPGEARKSLGWSGELPEEAVLDGLCTKMAVLHEKPGGTGR